MEAVDHCAPELTVPCKLLPIKTVYDGRVVPCIMNEAMQEKDPIKVYDARWEVGEFGDEEIARLFDAAIIYGRRLGVDTVTVTRDARLGAAHVMEIGVERALTAGLEVVLCTDPISTPQSYFLTARTSQRRPTTMGFVITASHNPGGYIGLKLTVPTVRAVGLDSGPEGGLTSVREIYHSDERAPASSRGCLSLADPTDDYVNASLACAGVGAGSLDGLPVVLDSFNGSAGNELFRALELAGARVTPLRLVPDGEFPTGAPNPTSRGKMEQAVRLAGAIPGAVVIGVDGDGDRLVFGSDRGILDAGFAAVAILESDPDLQKAGSPVPVLFDPKVNPIALEAWGRFSVEPLLFRNGHSQIKDYMTKIDARFGVEESGHYYHRLRYGTAEINAENSIVTTLRFLAAVHARPGTMERLWELQQRIYSTGEVNFQLSEQDAVDRAMDELARRFGREGAATITATPDGIDLGGTQISRGVHIEGGRMSLQPGWYSGYIRSATNEKAVLRFFFSAGDAQTRQTIGNEIVRILRESYDGRQIE